jgi:pimeloyl-ACP methyl ester carboxylesterase
MSQINYIPFNNGHLLTESFGNSDDPLVILIAGSEQQSIYWSDSFCHKIASAGYYVITYDHRDTGLSSYGNFNEHPYFLNDLATDILNIIEGYGKEKAHLIGSDMGGYLAQMLALSHPEKVESIVLLMTTHDARPIEQKRQLAGWLPLSSPDILKELQNLSWIPLSDPQWTSKTLKKLQLLNGKQAPFDVSAWEEIVFTLQNRTEDIESIPLFHPHVFSKALSKLQFNSKHIQQKTLIIHGDADPIIPVEHAYSLKLLIAQAKLRVIKGMGHLLTSYFEPIVKKNIINHLNSHKEAFA